MHSNNKCGNFKGIEKCPWKRYRPTSTLPQKTQYLQINNIVYTAFLPSHAQHMGITCTARGYHMHTKWESHVHHVEIICLTALPSKNTVQSVSTKYVLQYVFASNSSQSDPKGCTLHLYQKSNQIGVGSGQNFNIFFSLYCNKVDSSIHPQNLNTQYIPNLHDMQISNCH